MADDTKDSDKKRHGRFVHFNIIAHIASGGMGAVYKAIDTTDNCTVALKVMSEQLAAKPTMIARFRREARSITKLKHENIVEIKEFNEAEGTFYLALEFVEGRDLHDYISKSPGGRLHPEEARQIALQAARALDHAHQAGVVHRDVKPSNILIVKRRGAPLVKLTDFGLARHDNDDEHRVTKVGTTLGTVDYMAPEQARDSAKADIRSDLYALGCTLCHMLTGKPPFPKGSLAEKLVQHIEAEPPDVCKFNDAIPEGLGRIVRKMLAKKPRDRYQTPAELLADLEDPDRVEADDTEADRKPRRERQPIPVRADSKEIKKRPRKAKQAAFPWLPVSIGGGAVAVIGLIVLIIINSRRAPVVENKPEEIKIVEKKVETVVQRDLSKLIVGPPTLEWKRLYEPVLPLDPQALTTEFYGPFTAHLDPPADAKVIVVSRLPLDGTPSVRSLAEAFAQAQAGRAAVIEIRDQGPHYLGALPALTQCRLWIRGGDGVRPLLAWEGTGAHLIALTHGALALDNLDVAVALSDKSVPQPIQLCHLDRADFQARACTFSVAGQHPHGMVVASLHGVAAAAPEVGAEPKARFTRCWARGHDLTLLATDNVAADIMIDGSLVAGAAQPLVRHRNREEDNLTVRIIRSTLVAQRQLWRWEPSAGAAASPRVKAWVWDAILARSDAAAPEADLLHLAQDARASLMNVKIVNCLYAGWKNLLAAGDQQCATVEAWRGVWGHREGDVALNEVWPPRPLGALEELPASILDPHDTQAAFAATSGRGPVGCDLSTLPPEPLLWKQRTFERFIAQDVPLPEAETPETPASTDGLYHGETIELGNFDLGQHVQARLQTQKPGPRVVLRLTGKGRHVTSPLRFKGVEQVVIHFEQPTSAGKEKTEPLTLELRPAGGAAGLIDVEGGSLEMRHARIRFENSRIALLPPHMVRVRGGDLGLYRCTLIGPLSKAPDGFQSLVACDGAGFGGLRPTVVALRECTLQCGKPLLEVKNPGARLRCRDCLLYALGDVWQVDLSTLATSRPDIIASFENNTIAHRQAFVNFRCYEGPSRCLPVVVQTQANYFLDPFPEEPRQATLVKLSGESLARGLLLWQGKGNVLARDRLPAYYAAFDAPVGKQTFKDWEQLTGPAGETDALHVDAIAAKSFTPDQPPYDRLLLPPAVRLEPAPGADLAKLGLVKKK
ncbi:MAG: serine/threonine protein kinase [Gemmataceae bacterium]|nr:serine/threonine protein kinase [Gemmataceae bacterium]